MPVKSKKGKTIHIQLCYKENRGVPTVLLRESFAVYVKGKVSSGTSGV